MKRNSDKDLIFDTQIGQKATVQHSIIENDPRHQALRDVLRDIAKDMAENDPALSAMVYKGSFSVHVFAGKTGFAFAGLMAPDSCHYKLAEAASMKLREDIEEHYGGRRRKKRSGF